MREPPKKPKRLRLRTHTTDFSFRGRRYRVSLNVPLTPNRAPKLAAAVNAFALKQAQAKRRFVYFLQCDDRIKIGIARNPPRRLRKLQTGNAGELKLLAVIAGDADLERAIHEKFESARVFGEWFVMCPELEEFIHRVKRCDSVYFNHQENEIRMLTDVRRANSSLDFTATRTVASEVSK